MTSFAAAVPAACVGFDFDLVRCERHATSDTTHAMLRVVREWYLSVFVRIILTLICVIAWQPEGSPRLTWRAGHFLTHRTPKSSVPTVSSPGRYETSPCSSTCRPKSCLNRHTQVSECRENRNNPESSAPQAETEHLSTNNSCARTDKKANLPGRPSLSRIEWPLGLD